MWNAQRFRFFKVLLFPAKTKQLWKTAGYYVIQKLQFQTTSVKELLQVTIVCVDTIPVFLILIYHRALLAFSPCLNKELMWLARMLCTIHYIWCIYEIILWFHRKPTVKRFIGKKNKSNFWFYENLSSYSWEYWRQLIADKMTSSFQGRVATLYSWGDEMSVTYVKYFKYFVSRNCSNRFIFDCVIQDSTGSGVLLKMEVGIRKGAWRRAWRYPASLWSLRWVYAVKKTRRLVYAVYPRIPPQYTTAYRERLTSSACYCRKNCQFFLHVQAPGGARAPVPHSWWRQWW